MDKVGGAIFVDKSETGQVEPDTPTTPIPNLRKFFLHQKRHRVGPKGEVILCGLWASNTNENNAVKSHEAQCSFNVSHEHVQTNILSRQGMQSSLEAAIEDFGRRGSATRRNHTLGEEVQKEKDAAAAEEASKAAGETPLRFEVGHRVLANIGKYTAGTVIKVWDQGNPYRIKLDNGTEVNRMR